MPDDGTSFAVITNGDVAIADPPNDSGLAGMSNGTISRNVSDVSILEVDISVPSGDNCLAVDGVFYSEEYPASPSTSHYDGFIAELDTNDWTYDFDYVAITAPNNFAFDNSGQPLSVKSIDVTKEADTDLQYDGSTELLTFSTVITPGPHSLFLSVFDTGDYSVDSAMFLDNLRTFQTTSTEECKKGAVLTDTDGDGISNEWEHNGVRDSFGHMLLDLPAMGADPNHKDVFVQLDAMQNMSLKQEALDMVEQSFNDAPVNNPDGTTGIHLHVDEGPTSVMNPVTGATWGSLSKANDNIPYEELIGSEDSSGNYDWSAFNAIKSANFDSNREAVFHYALSINKFDESGHAGLSKGIPSSDFIVALGRGPEAARNGSVGQQAGTFMHELGHNLGLHHGGQVDTNNVPIYLSVMNYNFMFSGLTIGANRYDYSRYDGSDIPDLNENDLNEPAGFGVGMLPGAAEQKTLIWCPGGSQLTRVLYGPKDFNCNDFALETGVVADLNNDGDTGILKSYNDWPVLTFRGGAIGGDGRGALLPNSTIDDEPPITVLEQANDQLVPPPTGSTGNATSITSTSATLSGTATANGNATKVSFDYGESTDYGSQTSAVDIGSGSTSSSTSAVISGLKPNTVYHYREVIESLNHLVFATDSSFTTAATTTKHRPPNTVIRKITISRRAHKAQFAFKAIGLSTGFECALAEVTAKTKRARAGRTSKMHFSTCSSPKTYEKLMSGRYMFSVRAIGPGGTDKTPATRRFRI